MSEYRRVVVTGLGAITPIGNSVDAAWDSMINGRCGIGEITYFDTTDYKAKLDAEVKDFNARDWMERESQSISAVVLVVSRHSRQSITSFCREAPDASLHSLYQ